MRNFHLPLSEETYAHLRAEAQRAKVPATAIAREAIDSWLRQQVRRLRYESIATFAAEAAGTDLDLDTGFEAAGIEHLLEADKG